MQQEQVSVKELGIIKDQLLQILETIESTLQLGIEPGTRANPNEIMAQFNTILAKTKGISTRIQLFNIKNHVVFPHILYLQDPGNN